jgi:acyl carrier protein
MTDAAAVFEEVRSMVTKLLDQYDLDEIEITRESLFHDDLGLGAMLAERYGDRVNIATFLAELKIDDVIGLRLGSLVHYVCSALARTASSRT